MSLERFKNREMKMMKRKLLSILLCLAMLAGLLPQFTLSARAAGAVTYEPLTTEYAIFNRFNWNSQSYYDLYAKGAGAWAYNAVGKFSGLAGGTTYTRNRGTYSWGNSFAYDSSRPNGLSVYGELVKAGQLKVGLSASLHNVSHVHKGGILGIQEATVVAYQFIGLQIGSDERGLSGYDFIDQGSATVRLGDRSYRDVGLSSIMKIRTGVSQTYSGCNDGDCTVGDIAVTFADTSDPQVTNISVCDINGNKIETAPAGSTAYLRVEFNEPIRFANNNNLHDDVTVTLSNSTNPGAATAAAHLTELKSNYLTFRFTVPDIEGNQILNSAVLASLFTSSFLEQVKNGGSFGTTGHSGEGYNWSSTLITDIAGNPLKSPSAGSTAVMDPFYVDGVDPYVVSVTKSAIMNNSDVKAALGTPAGELDPSDTRAGVDDQIIFTANFNEKLMINGAAPADSNNYTGMRAELNVMDDNNTPGNTSDDFSVTVDSVSMAQNPGATDAPNNGASKGMYTSVTFAPFTVDEGMYCNDAEGIKVLNVLAVSGTAADLAGHAFSETSNPPNSNPFKLDTDPPTVTAGSGVTEDAGVYTPIPEAGSGVLITAFSFPFHIVDGSGATDLQGSFSWINNELGGTAFPFEYAITYGDGVPSGTDWQRAVMGEAYRFGQVEGAGNTTRIHIRLIDGTDYDMDDTTLKIAAQDYAGNKGVTSFDLDYMADGSAPTASVSNVIKNTGTLTVNVQVADPGGLKEISYLWGTDGTLPGLDDPDWDETGTFDEGDISAAVSAEKGGVTSGDPFSGYLFIKAEDVSGNVSVISLGRFEYDRSAPDYTAAYTQDKRPDAELTISGLDADGTVAVMLKNSLYTVGSDTEEYYVRIIDDSSYDDDVLNDSVSEWLKYAVSENGGDYSFTYDDEISDTFLTRVLNGTWYGPVNITLLAGDTGAFVYDTTYTGQLTFAGGGSFDLSAVPVTLNAAPGSAGSIHGASVTTGDTLSNKVTERRITGETQAFNPDSASDDMLSTLAGVEFTVTLSNLIVGSWGITDIDFNSTYLTVIRSENEDGAPVDTTVINKLTLSPAVNQTVTLPEQDYPSGLYTVRLTVTAKASGKVETFDYSGGIIVDASKASENFGLALVYTDYIDSGYNLGAAGTERRRYFGPLADGHPGESLAQYTAGDNTIYLPVNTSNCALTFTIDDMSYIDGANDVYYGAQSFKAWNVTGLDTAGAGAAKNAAGWLDAYDASDGYSAYQFHDAVFVSGASAIIENTGGNRLPLIKNTLNRIAFQVANANGLMSAIRYVYIYPVDAQVQGDVSVTDTGGQYVKEGKVTFTPAPGQLMDGTSVYLVRYTTPKETVPMSSGPDGNYTNTISPTGNHYYRVYTVDSYGNYTLLLRDGLGINWHWTDNGAPTVLGSPTASAEPDSANFTASVDFTDSTILTKSGQDLTLYFDSAYMTALGLTYAEDEGQYAGDRFRLALPVPDTSDGKISVFSASQSNPYGIFQVSVARKTNKDEYGNDVYDTIGVEIQGAIRYDDNLTSGAGITHTLYATLTDSLGNVSAPVEFMLNTKNIKPAYTGGSFGFRLYGGLAAAFNTPVIVKPSLTVNTPSAYSNVKTAELPVFGDGKHTVKFYDIFGTEWTQEIEVTDVFGKLSLSVELSEPGYTSDPVTVRISADDPETTLSVYTFPAQTSVTGRANPVEFTVGTNTVLQLRVYLAGDLVPTYMMLYINNILNGAPTANLHWYFDEFKSNTLPADVTQTTGSAAVWYTAARPVTPTGGTSASYTFRYEDYVSGITSYTFQYVDAAGNIGSVTADLTALGLTLAAPPVPPVDAAPPEFEITVYGKIGGIPNAAGYYSSRSTPLVINPLTSLPTTLDDVIGAAGYVQSYYFDISVTEDSPYKLLLFNGLTPPSPVTYESAGESVTGVSLSGRTLSATTSAAFTVAVVDANNNCKTFPISVGQYLDNTAPTVETVKTYDNFYQSRAYFRLDDLSDDGTHTNTAGPLVSAGLIKESGTHPLYPGWYYYIFTENRTLPFTAVDAAGNRTSAYAVEDSLDTTPPMAKVTWSPHYYDDELYDTGSPPNHVTNGDVVALVRYDKPVNVSPAAISAGGVWTAVTDNNANFTLTRASDLITLRFHKEGSLDVKLEATALNGKTCETVLYMPDVIDVAAPTVSTIVTYNYNSGYSSGTPVSATITLTVGGEDVYLTNYGPRNVLYDAGDSIPVTVYEKGRYTYIFTDAAGNSRSVTADVTQDLDRTPPTVNVVKGTEVISNKVSVTVSSSEDGKIAVNSASGAVLPERSVSKDEQVTLSIDNNGSYAVTAKDSAGNKGTAAFVVGGIDKEKPSIVFSPSTVSIRQNSSPAALAALLDTGYTVRDNVSAAGNITVNYDASAVALTVTGTYPVTYTAIDTALNARETVRYVKVYPENELEVLLSGKKTENGGTTLLNSTAVTLTVHNPLGDEPYTVYLRSGLKTAGQMKWDYSVVTPGPGGAFTLPANGSYTLYIVTQSRQSYLIKLSVKP